MSSRFAFVVLAACSGAPVAKPPDVANATALPARTTPTPRVSWSASEHRFVVAGLPAAAHDGKRAVVAIEGGDGGRGYPNLRLEVRSGSDDVHETIPIIAASDWEQLAPDGDPGPELDHRVAAANRQLAELAARADLVALPKLSFVGNDEPHIASDGSLFVEWNDGLVFVLRQPAADARPHYLARRRYEPAPTSGNCENPAYLAGAYHADGVNLIVIDVGYHGTDLCWEPAHQWHVITW